MSVESVILSTLEKYGEDMTLVTVTPSATPYNPATGLTPATQASFNFKGCITSYVEKNGINTLVINNLFKAFVPALNLGAVPEPQDKISTSSVTYNILEVTRIRLKGIPVAYICKVEI